MKINLIYHSVSKALKNMPVTYYAVAKGRKTGVYTNWDDCKAQVHQYSGPVFKKFSSELEALKFINEHAASSNQSISQNTCMTNKGRKKDFLTKKVIDVSSVRKRGISTLSKTESSSHLCKRGKLSSMVQDICYKVTDKGFIVDENGYTNVYTDGACSSNGNARARAGIGVWFADNHPLNVSQAVVGRATNNMAEIQAVTVAATQAKSVGIKKLKINTDSKFLISCITQWMPKWKCNGWKTADNKPVINKTELLEMEKALDSINVSWNHVNGHVGIYGNEMADKLAREGCIRY